MPDKMQRFTQRAKRVLSLAQEEAERLQQSYVGTEHILLGLMREEGGLAGRVLRKMGTDQSHVEEMIAKQSQPQAKPDIPNWRPDLSPGTKKVIELAIDEAFQMGSHDIRTEHLLLSLVRQNEGIAIDILKRMNITSDEIRRKVRDHLQENPQPSALQPPANQPNPSAQPPIASERSANTPFISPEVHRFTLQASHVRDMARSEALRRSQAEISADHLFLGLLRVEGSIAHHIFTGLKVDQRQIAEIFEQIQLGRQLIRQGHELIRQGEQIIEGNWRGSSYVESTGHPQWSMEAQLLMRLAGNEARRLNQSEISTGHILMAISQFTDRSATVTNILSSLLIKIDADDLYQRTRQYIEDHPNDEMSENPA